MKRFSALGSVSFERRFSRQLGEMARDLAAAFGSELEALVLAGGYGGGEGGVEHLGGDERPYNDLDLLPILASRRRHVPRKVDVCRREWQRHLGVHVDFSRPLTEAQVARWPHQLLWHDVVSGHRVLWGDGDVVHRAAPRHLFDAPPAVEATRLLLNRGAGLLEATRRHLLELPRDPDDRDFVRRNAYKADLAMMDAVLLVHRVYRPRVLERPDRLRELGLANAGVAALDLMATARRAVRFKVLPSSLPAGVTLIERAERVERFGAVLAYVEAVRRGRPEPSLRAVAQDRRLVELDRHRPGCLPLNLYRQLKRGRVDWRSPREELFPALAARLSDAPVVPGSSRTDIAAWCERAEGFFQTWREHS
ncbi:MAG: hypothetical protein AAGF23_24700 [Acidobacteriota bacterium]